MTVTTDEAGVPTFSEELRAASWGAHERAAGVGFMQALLAGELPIGRYAELVAQEHQAYVVLEEAAVAMADDPVAGPFVFDELTRLPALEADLAFLLGEGWREQVAPSEATLAYCDRLRQVCFDWPGGFVAHHYVRYLGDLSGGQFIRGVVERTYDLADHQGTQFYVFDQLDDLAAFKDEYRRRLDAAPWGPGERGRVIDEILLGYELNTAVLDALGR